VDATVALARDAAAPALEEALREFLSPWAADGPDVADTRDPRDLGGAVLRFLRGQPGVEAVADVNVRFAAVPDGARWVVPVAGAIAIDLVDEGSLGV
jgi:hypothetical protein